MAGSETLIGRDDELNRLESFVNDTPDGPATLLFEGEAGIGKSTLWRAGVEHARELGCRVLEARPAAAERELSYAALGDLLRGLHDEIGGLPAPQRRALRIALLVEQAVGDPADKRAIAAGVLELLRRSSTETPLVIALDDIQWLDPPSAGALQFALRRLEREPVRVLATSRVGTGLTLIGFDDAERISVGPLSLHALDRLVRMRLGARFLRPTLRQLEQASGGNPFYALEIAANLLRSGSRPKFGEPLPIPAVLRELVRDRLASLRPAAREAALAAAALAQPTVSSVEQVIGEGPAAVSDAVAAGVLVSDGETLQFSHPLFASTLYEDTPLRARRDVHKRLAEIVGDAEERARHLAEAADGPDEEVASALEAAAVSVSSRGAPDAAARLAKQAFDLTPPDEPAEAHRRCLKWAGLSMEAGDPQLAESLLERRIDAAARGRERAEAEFQLGKTRLLTRGSSAALACYERALREIDGTDELELRTRVLVETAEMHLGLRDLDSDASAHALALAEKLGKPDLHAQALGIHGTTLALLDRPPPDEYWRRALEIEKAAGALRYGGPTLAYGFAKFFQGDFGTTSELASLVADSMRSRGDPMLPRVLIEMSELARISGDWDAASRYLQEADDLVIQTGHEALEPMCLLWKARLALPRGDLDLARRHVEDATALLERIAASDVERRVIEGLIESVLGQIAAELGRNAEAHEHTAAAIEITQQLGKMSEPALAELLAGDVAYLVALGALDDATRQLKRLVELTATLEMPDLKGFVARTQGLVAAAEGDSLVALRHLEAAVESFETLRSPWPFQHAKTLLMLGGVERRARRKRAARETLRRALEIFDFLGARLWAEKTRSELRQISGRPARSGNLTATEQRVADLVAGGRSNAEVAHELFMSPKTVEWNLSKIYKKLHVRSRTELAGKLAKQAEMLDLS